MTHFQLRQRICTALQTVKRRFVLPIVCTLVSTLLRLVFNLTFWFIHHLPLLRRLLLQLSFKLDDLLTVLLRQQHTQRFCSEHNKFYRTNFKPVTREYHQRVKVIQGSLPSDLQGTFIRNGPNPNTEMDGQHWFDGDGMLHAIHVNEKGEVYYSNRFVETERLQLERHYQRSLHVRLGQLLGKMGLVKSLIAIVRHEFDLTGRGKPSSGAANTSLVYHAKRLFALYEADVPYEIERLQNGDLNSVGPYYYNGELSVKTKFTAHPKIDPVTGEMYFIEYSLVKTPFLRFGRISADGQLMSVIDIHKQRPTMIHDFAITENYAIFPDLSVVASFKSAMNGDYVLQYDPKSRSQFGILRRSACSDTDIVWIQVDSCFMFHVVNAWEVSEDEIVVYGCRIEDIVIGNLQGGPNHGQLRSRLHCWRFQLSTRTCVESGVLNHVLPAFVDFPRVHPSLIGRVSRFAYCATIGDDGSLGLVVTGCVKVDLVKQHLLKRITLEQGTTGGEPLFVPRCGAREEDDGYILMFTHCPKDDSSEFVVYDALTFSSTPLCKIALPQRVPHGFHAIFLHDKQHHHTQNRKSN